MNAADIFQILDHREKDEVPDNFGATFKEIWELPSKLDVHFMAGSKLYAPRVAIVRIPRTKIASLWPHCRDRTRTSCPCSGTLRTVAAMLWPFHSCRLVVSLRPGCPCQSLALVQTRLADRQPLLDDYRQRWETDWEPMVVAVIGATMDTAGHRDSVDEDEAIDIATDYLDEIGWFSEGPADPDHVVRV